MNEMSHGILLYYFFFFLFPVVDESVMEATHVRMNRASTRGNNGKEEKETRKRPADITNGGGVIFSDVLPAGG